MFAFISVTDTGRGMDRGVQNRMFEPYFTTQEFGRSAGLGLTRVYGIVKEHGGAIGVRSDPDCGTTVKVHLPIAKEPDVTATVGDPAE